MRDASIWLAVVTGGASGAVLRGLVYHAIERWSPTENGGRLANFGASRATVIVNILGSFVLGLIVGALPPPSPQAAEPLLAFWITGLCGAVTTFSTLCADAIGHARNGNRIHLTIVVLANALLGVAALVLGLQLTR
jgi:CrcB protein